MRRLHLATLFLTAFTLIACGCRQTTPANTGPMTPFGPMAPSSSLSPVGANQAPALNPFGGTTRVTPPATGSFGAPNNYMGGVAPAGQSNANMGAAQGFAGQGFAGQGFGGPGLAGQGFAGPGLGGQGNEVIGSGVQPAGWTETNSIIAPAPSAFGASGPQTTFGATPAVPANPRSGGMQIIDLTGAPAPPGYRPAAPIWNNPAPGQPAAPSWQPSGTAPYNNAANPAPMGVQSISVPDPGSVASRLTPLQSTNGMVPISQSPVEAVVPRTATAPVQGPSTEPVNSANPAGSAQDLPWRRPGTQY